MEAGRCAATHNLAPHHASRGPMLTAPNETGVVQRYFPCDLCGCLFLGGPPMVTTETVARSQKVENP